MTVQEWLGEDNQIGIDIWEKKYRYNNETFDEWLDRVSAGDDAVRQLIVEKKFLFGGRILANRGLEKKGVKVTLSNCYVIKPVEDNIESIFDCAKQLARTFSYGGGCGIDVGGLRPKGTPVNNAAKQTSGAVSFMDLYSMVTEIISQNGRRGALMISIPCTHPDLEEFIDCKKDLERCTKANISIRITDDFMKAVNNKEKFTLSFVNEDVYITKEIDAYKLFYKICENNWLMAEPGCLFWDRIENYNLLSEDEDFHYAGVNPCAEEPLPAYGSCLLGALNLAEFVDENKYFNFNTFSEAVEAAVIALNDVLDEGLPLHPLQEQRDSVCTWRQIGLGIMGLSDLLIKLGLRYGSEEAVDFCDNIGFVMANSAIATSAELAIDNGVYPYYKKCVIDSQFFKNNTSSTTKELVKENGLHNSQLLTIAPTGTISTMLGVSGGIEPIFANSYNRTTKSLHGKDVTYKVYTPIVKKYMEENNITDEADLPDYFVTSQKLKYRERINMQSVWQLHIDASISSTVNLPHEATIDDIIDLYIYAWAKGCKGVTIYRDGCQRTGILTTDKTDKDKDTTHHSTLQRGDIIDCTDDLIGKKRKITTGCGSLHILAFFDPVNGDLQEVYLSKGSTGGCQNFMIGLSRTISLLCRAGVDIYTIKDQLDSTGTCPSYATRRAVSHDTSKGSCCPMAIGNALIDMYKEMLSDITCDEPEKDEQEMIQDVSVVNLPYDKEDKIIPHNNGVKCPECGELLVFEGGCNTCKSCGYSKCS